LTPPRSELLELSRSIIAMDDRIGRDGGDAGGITDTEACVVAFAVVVDVATAEGADKDDAANDRSLPAAVSFVNAADRTLL
jgi:hypothetical protein